MKKTLLIVILLFSFTTLLSQEKYAVSYEKQGDKSMSLEEYQTAYEQYMLARKFVKKSTQLLYKCAEACRAMKDYDKAEYWYLKVLSETDSSKITTDFPNLYLHLADVVKSNGNPTQALNYLSILLEDCPFIEIRNRAKKEIDDLSWTIDNYEIQEGVTITNLKENINNDSYQSSAIAIDDSLLLFTTIEFEKRKNGEKEIYENAYQQIYFSFIDDNFYTPSTKLDWGKINSRRENSANLCFDKEANTVYFTRCNNLSNNSICEIFTSSLTNGKWSKPKRLNDKVNIKGYSSTHPCITKVGENKILYYSSNRPGGLGGYDIWFYVLSNDSSSAINLGHVINTKGNEITPFYSEEEETLYFSSDFYPGFGGYDLFKSEGSLNRWSEPQNLMQPINSPANDMYPFIVKANERGYFTSNRIGSFTNGENNTCCNDIYRFDIKEVKENYISTIRNLRAFNPAFDLPFSLYFHNDEPNPNNTSSSTKIDYKQCFERYKNLSNKYKAEYTFELSDSTESSALDSINNFFNSYLDKGMNKLNNMLEYLQHNLEQGKSIDISIRGYSSALFDDIYNFNLSERRIVSVINYISNWNKGVLKPYLEELGNDSIAKLNIKRLPFGKIDSKSANPRRLEDRRKSIYSIEAMLERKVEISIIETRK